MRTRKNQRFFYKSSRVRKMLQYLHCRDRTASPLRLTVFEAGCKQVIAALVCPIEIEPQIAHQPGQHTVATRSIQIATIAAPAHYPIERPGKSAREGDISHDQSGIRCGDRTGVGLIQPMGFMGTQKPTILADLIVSWIFA